MPEVPCATVSASHQEPAWATASIVRNWLLVEQPGAWGADAVKESRLPEPVAAGLHQSAARHRVRLILLRRPDRPRDVARHCFAAHSARPSPWIEHRLFDSPDELLDLDVASVAAPQPPGVGTPWTGPLYLVCTNGRHDPCCANLGRPVLRALLRERPDAVWECSHIGGDRFAGNLVCFPDGLYFGRVGPDNAAGIVEDYEQGRIDLDFFRGRAGDPFPVQAAEYFLRRDQGLVGIHDVVPLDRRAVEPGLVEARFAGPGGAAFAVRVRTDALGDPRLLTCNAVRELRPRAYELVGVFPQAPGAPPVH